MSGLCWPCELGDRPPPGEGHQGQVRQARPGGQGWSEPLGFAGPEESRLDAHPAPTGLFSTIMRDLANIAHDGPKWIILDGDIDPMWIESLNTVMDDNKV